MVQPPTPSTSPSLTTGLLTHPPRGSERQVFTAHTSRSTGRAYFRNMKTDATVWSLPPGGVVFDRDAPSDDMAALEAALDSDSDEEEGQGEGGAAGTVPASGVGIFQQGVGGRSSLISLPGQDPEEDDESPPLSPFLNTPRHSLAASGGHPGRPGGGLSSSGRSARASSVTGLASMPADDGCDSEEDNGEDVFLSSWKTGGAFRRSLSGAVRASLIDAPERAPPPPQLLMVFGESFTASASASGFYASVSYSSVPLFPSCV
jgi:hypothetical protein